MKPIPKDALPVIEVIRKHARRPRKNPEYVETVDESAYYCLRWQKADADYCPLGLLPWAKSPIPAAESFDEEEGAFTCHEAAEFIEWFDNLGISDAPHVIDAIWGKRKRPGKRGRKG